MAEFSLRQAARLFPKTGLTADAEENLQDIAITEFYRGGDSGRVPNFNAYSSIPTSGEIKLSDLNVSVNRLQWSATQVNRSYRIRTAVSITLPAATGGADTNTYTVSGLPTGLTFADSTRKITGTVTAVNQLGNHTITYTCRNGNETIRQTFRITIQDIALTWNADQGNLSYKFNTAISKQLPAATGGSSAIVYSVTGLPTGLSYNRNTRTISGRVTAVNQLGAHSIVHTATSGSLRITDSFNLTITAEALTWDDTQADVSYVQNATVSLVLPFADGGTGTITYSVSGLPTGLSFTAASRTVSGSVTAANQIGSHTITYTAASSGVDNITQSFDIEITSARESLAWTKQAADSTHKWNAVINRTLPAAKGGDGTYTYSMSGAPTGLTFTAASRNLAGRVTAASQVKAHTLTYGASDSQENISQSITMTIEAADVEFASTQANINLAFDTAIDHRLPAATGGNGNITYTLSGLPTGLSFDDDTRDIEGTVSAANQVGTHALTYTASSGGNSASQTFNLIVSASTLAWDSTQGNRSFTGIGSANISMTLPAASGGAGSITYTVTGLPTGLSFDDDTRVISGRRTSSGNHDITYQATAGSQTITQSFRISITITTRLRWNSSQANVSYQLNRAVSILMPSASGGSGSLTYSMTGLPTGLAFSGTTRRITGTVTAANQVAAHTITYQASRGTQTITQSFSLTITRPALGYSDAGISFTAFSAGVGAQGAVGYFARAESLPALGSQTSVLQNAIYLVFDESKITGGTAPYTVSYSAVSGGVVRRQNFSGSSLTAV